MAKQNSTAPAAPATAPASAPAAAPAKAKKTKKAIRVPAPQVLQDAVAKAATEAKVSPAIYIRDLVAKHLNVTIPASATRSRTVYGSKEEKKAAQKVRRASRNATVKRLLAALEAGTIKLEETPAPTPPAA